ncbi:MAG: STAS domain-containing protein, partial [Anaerolineae bacterium]|nr:STAS domain-containing protein [Anaerolineae bacterium]
IASAAFGLHENYGVEIVGAIPQGLPSISLPQAPLSTYFAMVLPAIGVLLVAFSEGLGVAHEFAEKHHYEVNADQELNATGIANVVSAFFGGMVAAGSMSASAVKEGAGARSQVTNLAAWIATIITLLFLTPLFAPLPEAVLAALIIHAVWHIIASRKLAKLRLAAPKEFWFGLLALAGVLFVDVLEGMIIGLVASTAFMLYRSSRPHIASLGRKPGTMGTYSDLARHPENQPVPGVLIARIDAPLYYANALTTRDQLKAMIANSSPPPKALIIDLAAQDDLDLTTSEVFSGLLRELREGGPEVYFADIHAPVIDYARKTDLFELIGQDHVFDTVEAAVQQVTAAKPPFNTP